MVDKAVREVVLPAELKQYNFSPEREEVILIDEALIDQWKTSPEKCSYVSSTVLQEKNRKPTSAIFTPPVPAAIQNKPTIILSPKSGLANATVHVPQLKSSTVPCKPGLSATVGNQEAKATNCKFRMMSPPISKTSSASVANDSQTPRNGSMWHIRSSASSSSSDAKESNVDILPHRSPHPDYSTFVVSPGRQVIVFKKACTKVQATNTIPSIMQSYCGKCNKLSEACDCGKNVVTCTVISSTCQPFQTVGNIKRKAEAAKQQKQATVISKHSFYGKKLNEQYEVLVSPGNPKKTFTIADSTTSHLPNIIRKRPRLGKIEEPECLIISSDEEEVCDKSSPNALDIPEFPETNACHLEALATRHERMRDSSGKIIAARKKTTVSSSTVLFDDEKVMANVADCKPEVKKSKQETCSSFAIPEGEAEESKMEESDQEHGVSELLKMDISCRSIRIGSYKLHPTDDSSLPATFTCSAILFTVPTVIDNEMVPVVIPYEDIASILAHFGKTLTVLFIYTKPSFGGTIRNKLQMTDSKMNYYDPCSEEETCKRITILPDGITEDERDAYRLVIPETIIKEISQVQANEILVRSVPVNPQVRYVGQRLPVTRSQTALAATVISSPVQSRPVIKLITYPPHPETGGIAVTSEDFDCLNAQEFLNDIIIDFYLKYLVTEKLTDQERKRIHVFNTFFYQRLTQKPVSRNSSEENQALTAQQKRHSRVKTWTKNVDIFLKDFIIVPINQNAHWFLAIVCFPGRVANIKPSADPNSKDGRQATNDAKTSSLDLCTNNCDVSATLPREEEMEVDAGKENVMEMDSGKQYAGVRANPDDPSSHTPVKRVSLVPYESGDDSSDGVGSSTVDEPVSSVKAESNSPYILMFDSLPGPSRWRIVATLREYLEVEWETKKGSKRSFDRETMKGINVRVPVQSNFSDCGVYLLQYVESFFENMDSCPKFELWFDEELIAGKRDKIKDLILDLQKKYNSLNANTSSRDDATSLNNSEDSS